MTTCTECGQVNADGETFCESCGRFLEWEDAPAPLRGGEDEVTGPSGEPDEREGDVDYAAQGGVAVRVVERPEDLRVVPLDHAGNGASTPAPKRGLVRTVLQSIGVVAPAQPEGPVRPADVLTPEQTVPDAGPSHEPPAHEREGAMVPVPPAPAIRRVAEDHDVDLGFDEHGDPIPVLPIPGQPTDPALQVPPPPAIPVPPPREVLQARPAPDPTATARMIVPVDVVDEPFAPARPRVATPPPEPVAASTPDEGPGAIAARAPGKQIDRAGRGPAIQPPSRPPEPGDIICPRCGEANIPSRHFCRRCALELTQDVAPSQARVPWWRRFFPGRSSEQHQAGDRPDAGKAIGEPRWRVAWRRLKKVGRALSRWLLAIIVITAVIAPFIPAAQPYRDDAIAYLESVGDSVRRVIAPQYVEVNPISAAASSSLPDHPPEHAADGFSNRFWAEAASGDGAGEVLSFTFEAPVDLDRVGFINGGVDEGQDYISQPRPRQVTLFFSDGTETELEFADDAEFQQFNVTARAITRVDIQIDSLYGSSRGSNAAITEVQFFRKQ